MRRVVIEHDGQRLALRIVDAAGAVPALVLPAMGVPARYYDGFAALLAATGIPAVVADLRGTGDSTPPVGRRTRYGYAEIVGDVDRLVAEVADRWGRQPLLVGHSLGGHAAALHLALDQGPVAGLVLIASGTPYHRLYPGRRGVGIRLALPAIAAVGAVCGFWPGDRLGFGGRQARGVMVDWAHVIRTGRFPALHGVDVDDRLAEVKTPVLAVSVAGDGLTPAATLDHFCAKFEAAEITRHHYTPRESGAPMDHFRWARAAGPLATRIAAFTARL